LLERRGARRPSFTTEERTLDSPTGERTPKASSGWFLQVIKANGIELLIGNPYRTAPGETSAG
jgi:hypothetical protein